MPYGLYMSAEGAMAQSKRLEVLANNLANADSPGFKRDVAVFRARFAEAIEQGAAVPDDGSINDVGGGILLDRTVTVHAPGPLKETKIKSDFAIDGDGFFEVQKGNERYLTRAGNFMVRANGDLVTPDGYPVLDDAGSAIVIDPQLGPWELTPDGAIQQLGDKKYLGLVRPNSLDELTKVGENLFRPSSPPVPVPSDQRHVMAGYLEQSGVKPTLEMMELIETSRAFEANINLIKHQNEMLGSLVTRVLKV